MLPDSNIITFLQGLALNFAYVVKLAAMSSRCLALPNKQWPGYSGHRRQWVLRGCAAAFAGGNSGARGLAGPDRRAWHRFGACGVAAAALVGAGRRVAPLPISALCFQALSGAAQLAVTWRELHGLRKVADLRHLGWVLRQMVNLRTERRGDDRGAGQRAQTPPAGRGGVPPFARAHPSHPHRVREDQDFGNIEAGSAPSPTDRSATIAQNAKFSRWQAGSGVRPCGAQPISGANGAEIEAGGVGRGLHAYCGFLCSVALARLSPAVRHVK